MSTGLEGKKQAGVDYGMELPKQSLFRFADLHVHTTDSDGSYTVREVLKNAVKLGIGYLSFTEDTRILDKVFRPAYSAAIRAACMDQAYVPGFFRIMSEKGELKVGVEIARISEVRTMVPQFERDTVVAVPTGPFKVRNSGTGKINSFYQQDNMYLCLNDENGKGMWKTTDSHDHGNDMCHRDTGQ